MATPLLFVIAFAAESVPVPVATENDIISPKPTGLPFVSVTTARIVLVLEPSAVKLFGLAVRTILLTTPGTKLTIVVLLMPPAVAVIVAVPRLLELVNMAVATPFVVVFSIVKVGISESRLPAVVVNVTVVPSSTLVPLLFFTVTVIRLLDFPSATILLLSACMLMKPEIVLYGESDKLHDSFSAHGSQNV